MKIGVLHVATGKYIDFVDQIHNDFRKHFISESEIRFFLFTDDQEKDFPDDVSKIFIERKGFPGDTLYRYHYFLLAEERLKECDYLFYTDVDMKMTKDINKDILGNLTAVYHPGFYRKNNGTFERRKQSSAYLPLKVTAPYFCGGVQGGRTESYLNACKSIKKAIDLDDSNGVMALWHDESHWNAYLHNNKPELKVLKPTYCYYGFPWLSDLKDKAKIIALDKDHEEIRK